MEADKQHILQSIAQSSRITSGEGQRKLELNLARANQTLHSTMAILAWPQAVHKKLVPKDVHSEEGLNICKPLSSDRFRESLELSLAHFENCVDSVVKTLAESLPANLVDLKLSFEGCHRLTDLALQSIALGLQKLSKLRRLHLDFVGCSNLTDAGLRLLAKAFKDSQLTGLELHFAGCQFIRGPGVLALEQSLPNTLRQGSCRVVMACFFTKKAKKSLIRRAMAARLFNGSFKGSGVNRNFQSLDEFVEYAEPSRVLPFFGSRHVSHKDL